MQIRKEREEDLEAIRQVHREAFGRNEEAALVDRLRQDGGDSVSLVAEVETGIIGHVLFTEACLAPGSGTVAVGALGPIGVVPFWRRRGVAAALIREGLSLCWQQGWPAVIVLGDPAYYSRFGFARADAWCIRCEFDVPPEAFMILFRAAIIPGPAKARYHPAFGTV